MFQRGPSDGDGEFATGAPGSVFCALNFGQPASGLFAEVRRLYIRINSRVRPYHPRALFIRDRDKNVIEFDHQPGAAPEAWLVRSDDIDACDQHP